MKKLVVSLLSLLFLILLVPHVSHAATDEKIVSLYLDGKLLKPEVPARLNVVGTTMVPIRIVSEELGAKVTWLGNTRQVRIEQGDKKILLTIDKKAASVNGTSSNLDSPAVIDAGNTLVPVRFVSEQLGLQVNWNGPKLSVSLLKNVAETPSAPVVSQPAPIVLPPSTDKPPTPIVLPPNTDKLPVPDVHPHEDFEPVKPAPTTATPPVNTVPLQSIQAVNDQLVITANGPIKPRLFPLKNPDRLVIDLPGTTFSSTVPKPLPSQMNEVPVQLSLGSKVRYAFNDPATATIRVVVDLSQKSGYTVVDNKNPNQLIVSLKKSQLKVVIDAGHGDHDPGAKSVTGKREKDLNLTIALKVKKLMQQIPEIQTYLTRDDDTFIPLDDRVAYANNLDASLFVSIHANAWMASTNGTETYYYNEYSKAFAQAMHPLLVQATGLKDNNVRVGDFRVINKTTMPGILLETGYLTNAKDEAQLFNPAVQDKIAAAIVAGIKTYLNIP